MRRLLLASIVLAVLVVLAFGTEWYVAARG